MGNLLIINKPPANGERHLRSLFRRRPRDIHQRTPSVVRRITVSVCHFIVRRRRYEFVTVCLVGVVDIESG